MNAQAKPGVLADRLEPVTESGCHLWTGSDNGKGYGKVRVNGRQWLTHRLAYVQAHGAIPAGAQVLHKCDTPSCCNPSHLYAGTHKQNMADRTMRGRGVVPPSGYRNLGTANASALIDEQTALSIFQATGTQQEIADLFGVSRQTVSSIKRRAGWAHVTAAFRGDA